MKRLPRVLVADCHEDVLIAIEHSLEDAGFDTTTAWTGREVVRLLESLAFDVILLNEYLPDGNAEDLLRAIRRRGVGTPCMIMQPSASPMLDTVRFHGLGVTGIVCKHSLDDLLDGLRGHFRMSPDHHTHPRAVPA